MASDSFVAEEDQTLADPVAKIWTSGGLLFAYSGQLSLRDKLRAAIEISLQYTPLPPEVDAEMAASQLCSATKPILNKAYGTFEGGPNVKPADELGGSLLVIGRDTEKYWLLEVDRHNMPNFYTENGFHTIGSGSLATHIGRRLLRHYSLPGYETRHLCLLAYRVVESCIDVLQGSYGIGGDVQLWQSCENGYETVVGDELVAVREGLEQWHRIEREALLEVSAAPEPAPEEAAEAGLPPAITEGDS